MQPRLLCALPFGKFGRGIHHISQDTCILTTLITSIHPEPGSIAPWNTPPHCGMFATTLPFGQCGPNCAPAQRCTGSPHITDLAPVTALLAWHRITNPALHYWPCTC
eukprot:1159738-Pelagomonas_calceolata.AAC.8